MRLISPFLPTALAAICLLGLAGCGGGEDFPTTPISGKVTFDGQAVKGGSVMLTPAPGTEDKPAGKPATGTVGEDGTFTLSTYGDNDGAVIGKHSVSYTPPAGEVSESPSGHEQTPKSPYAGLKPKQPEVDIKEGMKELNIELTK